MTLKTPAENELPLGRHLAILTKMYYGALSKRLEHLEIEKHYSVLVLIERHKETSTQQFIGDILKIDKASMVSVVDYLEKKKFIKRVVNPSDRRAYLLELTPKAKKVMPEIHAEIAAMNKVALKGMKKSEATAFNSALCRISSNLNKQPSAPVVIQYTKIKKK
jgi:DNA-binding MarR family transcriptional regulator